MSPPLSPRSLPFYFRFILVWCICCTPAQPFRCLSALPKLSSLHIRGPSSSAVPSGHASGYHASETSDPRRSDLGGRQRLCSLRARCLFQLLPHLRLMVTTGPLDQFSSSFFFASKQLHTFAFLLLKMIGSHIKSFGK